MMSIWALSIRAAVIVLFSVGAASGCIRDQGAGEVRTTTTSVPADGVSSARVAVDMHYGLLTIRGGASDLVVAEFEHNSKLTPDIESSVDGDRAEVSLTQPERKSEWPTRPLDNHSELALSEQVPIDLDIMVGFVQTDLGLTDTRIASLELDSDGRGNVVGLNGDHRELRRLDLHTTEGEIWLNMEGAYADFDEFTVESGSGMLTLVLTGTWERDADLMVRSDSGTVMIHVPVDVGVRIEATTQSGELVIDGFTQEDGAYVNDAWGNAPVTLRIQVETVSGDILVGDETQ